jgi:phosphohistidine phosphatase SixA
MLSPAIGSLRRLWLIGTMALACVSWNVPAFSQDRETVIWNAVRAGGHVVLLRHAIAPGVGDPPGFTLGNCSTQRNLSVEGRAQAAKIGELFRVNGIRKARVFSSQWCRCLDTARLLELGPVQELPILNSFFERSEREKQQTRALRKWLAEQHLNEPLVLISHQVNITALTGVYPASGELVVIRRSKSGAISVVGSTKTD